MKELKKFLFEALFLTRDFKNPKHTYVTDVINTLCTKNSIRIGDKGQEVYSIDASIQADLKADFDAVGKNIDIASFNSIVKKYGIPEWGKLFKGDFSGYTAGLASKNKGNAFEIDFVENFQDYVDDFAKCLGKSVDDFDGATLDLVGGQNTKRPLTVKRGNVIVGNIKTSGDALADVVVIADKKYNASLKCGNSVTFINCGIGKIFTKQEFNKYKQTGVYEPTDEGKQLLEFFGIDKEKFVNVFVNYVETGKKKRAQKEVVDVTDKAKTREFYEFLKSVIGYNYILVHKTNNVHYYDLTTEKQLEDFIGNIESMQVLYPQVGDAKRVDVLLETNGLSIKFNIKSKDGGIYPTHLMSDYTIKH